MKAPMKAVVTAACLCLGVADAAAVSRYDPTHMSCSKVQATVSREGAVILRYRSPRNPSLTLFDRYVAAERFCSVNEMRVRASVPSADMDSCPVFRCQRRDSERRHHRLILPRIHRS